MVEQRLLFEPIRKWLEFKGFTLLKNAERIMVPIKDVFPIQYHIQPDVIGIKNTNQVCVVEVETNLDKMLEVMGKCMLWKTTASYVYIAYPRKICHEFKILKKFGIGLLSVSGDAVEEFVKIYPSEEAPYERLRLYELHPVDFEKEAELYRQIKRLL